MVLVAISDSVERGFDKFFAWLPNLVGALAVLVIGYFVAKIISGAVWRGVQRAGLDRTLSQGRTGDWVQRVTPSPSRLVGRLTFWALMLATLSIAASVLGVAAIEGFVAAIWAYIPNVLAALAIFLVAGAISAGVAALATRAMGDTPLGKIIATAAPIIVMSIAIFMILEQLEIAPEIVRITYAALLGAVALGSALAFGLGGRDVAARMLEGAYQRGQANKEQYKQDLDQGMQRAREQVEEVRSSMQGDDSAQPAPGATTPMP